mmetsp:Transcript_8530/g.12622  ORF Transcript_8530/g.12622 Transcript_8530/m.12622 type:complete len:274 (+) Transcript_8530:2407-3228(+)
MKVSGNTKEGLGAWSTSKATLVPSELMHPPLMMPSACPCLSSNLRGIPLSLYSLLDKSYSLILLSVVTTMLSPKTSIPVISPSDSEIESVCLTTPLWLQTSTPVSEPTITDSLWAAIMKLCFSKLPVDSPDPESGKEWHSTLFPLQTTKWLLVTSSPFILIPVWTCIGESSLLSRLTSTVLFETCRTTELSLILFLSIASVRILKELCEAADKMLSPEAQEIWDIFEELSVMGSWGSQPSLELGASPVSKYLDFHITTRPSSVPPAKIRFFSW